MAENSGLPGHLFMDVEEARKFYRLEEQGALFASEVDQQLAEFGIATIEMPLNEGDFKQLLDGYAVCLGECPEVLTETSHNVDKRFGNHAGHERKERKFNHSGKQIQDPKNLIHFNELARKRWGEQFKNGPKILQDFLADGYEIHNALIAVAKEQIESLEETHPNISRAYFPGSNLKTASHSYMRLLRYDSYRADDSLGEVAKAHFDIGGATIQAYADAPGFWGAKGDYRGERVFYDTQDDQSYFFLGSGHKKLYGSDTRLQPLYHGVDRVIPAGATIVPERHAVILFIDCPLVDYGTKPQDTLPELATNLDDELREAIGYTS